MISVRLAGGTGKGYGVKVTEQGQLVTAPLSFSRPYAVAAAVVDTAYVVVPPLPKKQFVITDIILDADKNVSAATAGTVVLYEAASTTSTTPTTTVLSIEMLKNTGRTITGLNMIVTQGSWLSLKTSDATVYATILGYYLDV